jgi:hypothetical protein
MININIITNAKTSNTDDVVFFHFDKMLSNFSLYSKYFASNSWCAWNENNKNKPSSAWIDFALEQIKAKILENYKKRYGQH